MEVTYYGGANGNRFIRFDSGGNLLVAYDGVPVGNQSYIGRTECLVTNDSSGDFFLYHATGNGSGAGLNCYRFNNTASPIWGPVNVVQGTSGLSYQFSGISDDNGITFVWQGTGSGSVDLFARRLTLNGAFAWGGNTVNVCTAGGSQENFHMKQKDLYLYVAWADGRPGIDPGYYDIYAQKLDTTGYIYWSPDGIEIASFNTYGPYPMIEVLDNYSIIVNHQSTVAGFMAQKVEGSGSLPWGANAYQVSIPTFNPFYQMHTLFQSDENTIVAWNKAASGGGSDGVYITRIDAFTGISEVDESHSILVFPNPASDKVEIRLDEDDPVQSVSLFDPAGRCVASMHISQTGPGNPVVFDISGYSPGIYQVKATGSNKIMTEKLILR
jgi:hypothetical protein